MKLLMHTCCAPCSVYCIDSLRNEGIEPVSFWYNPNIHPYIEYKTRRDTLIQYSEINKIRELGTLIIIYLMKNYQKKMELTILFNMQKKMVMMHLLQLYLLVHIKNMKN